MLIPDRATIFIPIYTLHNTRFEDPAAYNPDHYLDHPKLAPEYAMSADYESRDHYAYGAGRRICPGMHLAERTQWRFLAAILWAFEVRPVGNIDLDHAFEDGFFHYPLPYKAEFVPRSEQHVQTIRREFGVIEELPKKWE